MTPDEKTKPRGLIRYVLMVVSNPVQPTPPQMSAFLMDILPEFKTQHDGTGKVGFLWETKPMSSIDVPALAIETFGSQIMDASRYTYRTLHIRLQAGEAKCLVVYDVA